MSRLAYLHAALFTGFTASCSLFIGLSFSNRWSPWHIGLGILNAILAVVGITLFYRDSGVSQ